MERTFPYSILLTSLHIFPLRPFYEPQGFQPEISEAPSPDVPEVCLPFFPSWKTSWYRELGVKIHFPGNVKAVNVKT